MSEKVDFGNLGAPFVKNTFTLWREIQFNKLFKNIEERDFFELQQFKFQFAKEVDSQLFPNFIERIKKPYHDLVHKSNYCIPNQAINKDEIKDYRLYPELNSLAENTALWCIEVEILSDILERIKMYDLCKIYAQNDKIQEMRKNFMDLKSE